MSADPAFSDTSFASQPFPHGGFSARGRGRGRGDFDFHNRSRRPQFDDRPPFRQRSPPPRWGRDSSRESRDEWRTERPEEDRWANREPRDRETSWNRMSMTNQRFDTRSTGDVSSRPPTPSQTNPPQPPTPSERTQGETRLPPPPDRRASTSFLPRPDANTSTDQSVRAETFAARPRASSPPQAPSVPAFGAMNFSKPAAPPPNVWRADNRPPQSPVAPAAAQPPSPAPKPVPTAPKALAASPPPPSSAPTGPSSPGLQRVPVEAPRGPRGFEGPPPPAAPPMRHAPQPPTGPAAFRSDDRPQPPSVFTPAARDRPAPSTQSGAPSPNFGAQPWAGQPAPPTPKSAHREVSAQPVQHSPPVDRRPPAGPASLETRRDDGRTRVENTPPIPTGPRQQQSPLLTSPRVPTAPKADRAPPTGPRAGNERGMAALTRAPERPPVAPLRPPPAGPRGVQQGWNTWQQPQQPRGFREGVVPSKRDANGDEVPRGPQASPSQKPAVPAVKDDDVKMQDDGSQAESVKREQDTDRKDTGEVDDVGDPVEPALDSSSDDDDDGMDLDEEDFEMSKRKFEERKAQLEAQKVDLSSREYRVTTPFEQIARIAKITVDDLPAEGEMSPEAEAPELEEEEGSGVASGSTEEVDQDLLTPKEEEAEDIEMRDNDALDDILPPPRREPSPEIINLPYLAKGPFSPDALRSHILQQEDTKPALIQHFQELRDQVERNERSVLEEYADRYRELRDVTRQIDDERAQRERLERQKSADFAGEAEPMAPPAETPTTEGSRRLHKFSSEYDIQKVLKESEEMARKEQEKMERDAQRARDSVEKEAVCPPMYDEELLKRTLFKNTNNLRRAEHLIAIFGYQPPSDDFSPEEHQTFLEAFKERPKKWGEIAALLPGRTYQHCIHHYYAHKWDGRFRETKGKRKGRGVGRGRGGKVATRVRGAALMADLTRAEDDAPAPTTENGTNANGRPKRAAAVRGAAQEPQPESRGTSATPARKGGKTEGEEKPAKKRRANAGEKAAKKIKAQQPLAAASTEANPPQPAGSPVKTDRDLQFRANELTNEERARMDEANLLAGFQAGAARPRNETVPVYHTEAFFQPQIPVPEPLERMRIAVAPSQSRQAASSYWSVPEQNDFLKFLGYYGTDFAAIAAQMGTKTQTMVSSGNNNEQVDVNGEQVKNHYQRRIEGDNKEEFLRVAEEANLRRQRGEDLGPPPQPTPIVKRRYDNPPAATSRPVTAQAEAMEEDPGRFVASAIPSAGAVRTAPTPLQTALANNAKVAAQPGGRPSQPPGPRMGFFSESRETRPPQQPPTSRPPPQPVQASQPGQAPPQQRSQEGSLNTEWYQNLIQEQERALKMQHQSEIAARSQDKVPQLPHASVYPNLAPQPASQSRPPTRPVEEKGPPPPPPARPGSASMRSLIGSPAQSATGPPPRPPPTHPGQNPSPPKLTGFRPSSVPAGSPVQTPSLSAKPAEPRKTSNLASLLNSEPEEPRPVAKRMSDHSVQGIARPQSPASIQRNPTPTSSVLGQRRDTFGSSGPPRSFYDRPGQSTPVPTPPQPNYDSRWSNIGPARREEWPPRQVPPPPSASPGPNGLEPRANPSPPPHLSHSRHGSFSAPGGPPTQQPPPPHPMSGHPMSANPFGQAPPGHVQGMSQHNSPVTQAPPGQPFHARRPSREEDYRAQAQEKWGYRSAERRDYERPPLSTPSSMDREREREAQAQAQARYAADRDAAARDREYHAAESRFRSNTGPPPPGPGIGGPPMPGHPSGHPSTGPPPHLMSQPPPGYPTGALPPHSGPPSGPGGFRPDERSYEPPSFRDMRGEPQQREMFRPERSLGERMSDRLEREGYEREMQQRERENAYARDREMQRERDVMIDRERQMQQRDAQQRDLQQRDLQQREAQRQRDFEREREIQREREMSLQEREAQDRDREMARKRDERERLFSGPPPPTGPSGDLHRSRAWAHDQPPPPQAHPNPFSARPGERHDFPPAPPQREPYGAGGREDAWRRQHAQQQHAQQQMYDDEERRRRRDDEMRMMQREPYLPRSASGGSLGSVQGPPPPGYGPGQGPPQGPPQGPGGQGLGMPHQQPGGAPLGYRHHPPPPPPGGPGGLGAPGAPSGPRR
ncbi:Myb-like DNA-binding domain-containing protein 2 [Elsinoe australis]|uniref:Myb-like DNA-binding domain-containing protein 2 n=1 Tax=Elsinoe australis TaxID=40998 RepID=A0A4U7B8Z4_9PEZI|nr:Myb-like DNA-binding domain-containing protein 2 [Elsinoe australis]